MRRVHRYAHLPAADRQLLVEAALLLGALRVGLWLLPFRLVRRLAGRAGGEHAGPSDDRRAAPERIAWAVGAASRYVPAATCLAQALAAQALLGRHGYPAVLRIGVARGSAKSLGDERRTTNDEREWRGASAPSSLVLRLRRLAFPTASERFGAALEAHAWVECQGRIVIGAAGDLARYIRLPALDGERR
jgi:hypothetical protein